MIDFPYKAELEYEYKEYCKSDNNNLTMIEFLDKIIKELNKEKFNLNSISTIGDILNPQIKETKKSILYSKLKWIEKWKTEIENKSNKVLNDPKTLQSNLTIAQIVKLHKRLIDKEYINPIVENNFVYFFSNKILSDVPKIKWKSSKGKALYLIDKICINVSMPVLNHCIETNHKLFDSNDRKKIGYKEIDDLLNDL